VSAELWIDGRVRGRAVRADERYEVPDHPQVRELVGVHDRADAADLAAGDLGDNTLISRC
jgi:hypothetical protein